MKKQFQSKAVPRGTRTIWRYLGALFILFTFAIGNVWGTSYIPGDCKVVTANETIDYATIAGANATTSGKWIVNPRGGTTSGKKYTNLTSDTKGNPDGIVDNIATITSNVDMATIQVPSTAKYNQSGKYVIHMRITGITGIIAHGVTGSSGRGCAIYGQEYSTSLTENTEYGSALASMTRSGNSGSFLLQYTGFTASKEYLITIAATGGDDQLYAIELIAPSCTKPGTPTSLAAGSVTHNSASLSWTAGANNDGHKIYIEKKSDKTKVLDWTDATSPYAASGLDPETTYTFKVKAKGATGYCELGDEASADFATEVDPSATTYKVTLVPAGGTISDATGWTLNAGNYEKEVSSGTELALPTFTKANRTFKTWRKAGPTDVTSPITVTADVTLTAVWNATVENVIYSWEGAEGGATEVGGTAQSSTDGGSSFDNAQINVAQAGYYCIQLNGKNDYSTNIVEITLSGSEKVKAGDKIRYTGFYNHTDTKNAAPKMRASDGTAIFTGSNLPNINSASPRTDTHTVPEGINTATVQLTRAQTQSSSFLTKLQIIREVLVEEANIRTVTFNYNDGVTANVTVEVASGSKVSAPADPTYAHHRFHEWQLGGVAYDFATAVTADITLVADWTQLYTVTYAKGEESATGDAPTQDELAAGEKFTVAANPFAYDGHDFSTWNDGSADVAPGTEYTMGAANVTLTAQWITATTKVTVTYKDGETTLGSEEITINTGNPVDYATYQTRNLATFDGWYNDPDLAEGHKIADISALTASANVNVYGKWNYQYAASANIEQWVLTNGTSYDAVAQLGTLHYASNIANSLDSLNDDPSKDNRNYAYLGLKIKSGGKMLDFRLANGQTVKVKFGATGNYPQVALNGGSYAAMSLTDYVWTYTAEGADAYISIKTANNNTVVIKQIMINEDIAAVTLPWRVTYDANGGTCATAEAIWSGAALILPDVTPADADHTFAGWYDEVSGGVLVGTAGASYSATDNITLHAQFAPVEYAIAYDGNGATSGSMTAGAAGWGTLVTPDANAFVKSGNVFSGWVITKTSDGSATGITFSEGKFEMPKYDVTLVAQWDDVSKVAVIVETNVKYESLADAVAAATDGQTIQLLQNNNVTAQVEVAGKAITLDLAGYKIEYTGTSTLPSGVILVHNGASLTIDDSSDPDAGSIVSGADAYAAIALTKAGDNPANPAVLVVNGGTLIGYYYAITGHGSRPNTEITINGGVITATAFEDNFGIYHPQNGTLTVNGGTITAYSAAVEMRAGELEINGGTFTATAPAFSCNPNGSGTTTVGAAIAIAQHTTKVDIAVTINGGEFNGVKAVNESNPQVNDPAPQVAMAITDGEFNGAVETVDVDHFISGGIFDNEVSNAQCAENYVPKDNGDGTYGVKPKEGAVIIGADMVDNSGTAVEGINPIGAYYGAVTAKLKNLKVNSSGYYIGLQLTAGQTFQKGDVLNLHTTTAATQGKIELYEEAAGTNLIWATDDAASAVGDNKIVLTDAVNGYNALYIVRKASSGDQSWNGYVDHVEVTRPMQPLLIAFSVDGRDGVIDEVNKTVAVNIPFEADLDNLTIVDEVLWNEAAATDAKVVTTNSGAWVESPETNTYRLTDKDGDYTDYIITLTRDVQKHAVKFYDGETLLETVEVEDGESIDAGDVPADPTKEDYVFQGWAETADGAVVDVTSFTISATKNFYAKWAAETGVIKLLDGEGNVNTTDFITAVTAGTVNFDAADHNCVTFGSTASTVINQSGANKYIVYNARTNQTKIKFVLYNTNSSAQQLVLQKIAEGETAIAEGNEITIDVPSKERFETPYYTYNSDVNRTMYVFTKNTNIKVLQVKVVDDGAPVKQVGEAGYSLNLNVGRVFAPANTGVVYDGLTMETGSNYKVLNSTEFQTTKNFSFSIASPVLLKVTTNAAKYYVSQNPDEDGTTATAITAAGTEEISLSTIGTWYLVPSSTSNVKFTNIAFELPKCEKPVITTEPVSKLTFGPGDMTATVVAAEPTEGTLSYQWYNASDDSEVGGATDATLTTTTEGTYYVIVTNSLAGHQDNSTKSAEATLGYRVTNDATLMALSYGGTAITLEDGVYNYNVELAKGTTDVPALAATATMDGYATVTISNAAEFVSYAASSTVTVKSEDATVTNVYTVNFYVKHDLPQVDVTATTTWNWANAAETMQKILPETKDVEQLMANIDDEGKQLKNDAEFNSQALIFSGQEALEKSGSGANTRWFAKGGHIKFNVTVPGTVEVEFSDNGNNNRRVKINDAVSTVASASNTDVKTYKAYVQPGEVMLMGVKNDGTGTDQYIRISKITFTANPTPDYTRNVTNNIGTLCVDHNVLAGGALGATFYQIASRNELYDYKIDFEEVLPNEELKAGEPYIFQSTTGRIDLFYGETVKATPVAVRGMIGNYAAGQLTITDENKLDILYIAQNKLWTCENLVGSYLTLNDHRAYIQMSAVPTFEEYQEAQSQQSNNAPRRRVTLGKDAEQTTTGVDNLNASEQPVKLLINGQLFIIRGEKMFNANGQLVK